MAVSPPIRLATTHPLRVVALLVPSMILTGAGCRLPLLDPNMLPNLLLGGAAVLLLIAIFAWARERREPVTSNLPVFMLYFGALGLMMIASGPTRDWYFYFAKSALLIVPLGLFARQFFSESGVGTVRLARLEARRLARRRRWPDNLDECRLLPEVLRLRAYVQIDAGPALEMLSDKRIPVQLAALAALEYRDSWRSGQALFVLDVARQTEDDRVRAAAIRALGRAKERAIVESLGEFLSDPAQPVRVAAGEVLLSNDREHWQWIRHHARRALADPICQRDGPLGPPNVVFGQEAEADLAAWASEKGLLGLRSAVTLGRHVETALTKGGDPQLVQSLRDRMADSHAPPMLRLELARRLQNRKELDKRSLRSLLDPATPAPLRLIAVEALLGQGDSAQAVAALHDLARLPNREIALAVADVAQRRLGIDFGLPPQGPLPSINSTEASEIARRVLEWSAKQEVSDEPPAEVGSDAVSI